MMRRFALLGALPLTLSAVAAVPAAGQSDPEGLNRPLANHIFHNAPYDLSNVFEAPQVPGG